jgi:6,7-dimethyl-8-ribityllumazine synthase
MNQKDYSLTHLGEITPANRPELPPGAKFAFIEASWHADIVQQARTAFIEEMHRLGVEPNSIDVIKVPGAYEIPLHSKKLACSGVYSAITACALVVDGGIYRHEFVAQTVIQALMTVQLETEVPVISAVLTPHHFHEHIEHRKYFQRHFGVKGVEAARACAETVASLYSLSRAKAGFVTEDVLAITEDRKPALAA